MTQKSNSDIKTKISRQYHDLADSTLNLTDGGTVAGTLTLDVPLAFSTASSGISLTEVVAASVDAATVTVHGKKVTVKNKLQGSIADGAQSAAFTVTNNSVDTNSVVVGNIAGDTSLICGLSGSILQILNSADNTFKFAFQNETAVAVPDDTPFTASFVVL